LDIKDGLSTEITMSCQDILDMVNAGPSSTLTINADAGDSLVITLEGAGSISDGVVPDIPFTPVDGNTYTVIDDGQTALIHWVAA
jgi:hypothetical protein